MIPKRLQMKTTKYSVKKLL